nr:outer membrane protease E [Erwinia amylovora ATCC BAA-2158]
MRSLKFRAKTSDSGYHGTSVDAGYYVTLAANVFSEFSYNKYEEGKGGIQIIDTSSADSASLHPDAAGISNRNHTVTVSLQYRLV